MSGDNICQQAVIKMSAPGQRKAFTDVVITHHWYAAKRMQFVTAEAFRL